ncbi:uncharacterized protein LOC129947845 [Eupeodes corollae]|uniref:uncharacterized protein LOC129947845 n=1 Tax=Eupeodes corollae TaxID=290404 RepID=UPI00249160B4|nr:uncharacterized protein LOC129947845 [Eupeodes corollae]XP_055914553.1 uncharacterized protein LOC129947845 [Eupeodes corollae]XP_055914554.1 uncharacterized protein LOC129947845 [Eupeodes corollae]XP_055914555.1 uncharacterized protein LOC129947845 [Eupeodes corollae]XP_055914556.1 uncharacterized protein LOC129947845 [Eupeodes corollae]XP_055914557.1 uncharacterized protein LOC129947845 [Eupeodes corollae]XP_055914558.1 uncharacterized protein LOC129947845 [Eupeodes corollae]XP_05591455
MWSPQKGPTRLWDLSLSLIFILQLMFSLVIAGNEIWPLERPDGMPNIVSLEVMCGKDHMDVHLTFSHPFEGIVSSKGQHSDPRCVYVPPSTGKTFFSFRISYSRCGTKPDLHGQFYENTVVVQYDKDLLEVWDEAKRLRCEWFNDYEKTASKPPMVIADLDVIQLDFRGDNVDCWMEIQHGKGPWAPPVSGIVPLGSTLTLVVAINDYRGEFDMRVKSCVASDGSGHIIKLSDEFGCVLRPKMISRFLKARAPDERATVITYAFFHAFKFPDALSVHIKCKVEICRHGCLDHCQLNGNVHERKDIVSTETEDDSNAASSNNELHNVIGAGPSEGDRDHDIFYDDIIHNRKQLSSINNGIANMLDNFKMHEKNNNVNLEPRPVHEEEDDADLDSLFENDDEVEKEQYMELKKAGKFPQGPRLFEAQNRMGVPVAGPRSLEPKTDDDLRPVYKASSKEDEDEANNATESTEEPDVKNRRRRRSIVVSDRKARSADVGVSGLYDVISEADLAFSPDTKQEAVTVFQGKISEDVVYGICMPVPGFSILFIVVVSATIVSALIAGSLLYRYQLQKEALEKQTPLPVGSLASWMTLRLFRMRHEGVVVPPNQSPVATAAAIVHETPQ